MNECNQITYNARLILTNDEYQTLYTVLDTAANAYDYCSDYIKNNNIPLNIRDVHNAVYDNMRKLFPSIPAQGVIRIYKDVLGAFRSIKSNKHDDAQTPHRSRLSMRLDKRLYGHLVHGSICLSGFEKNKRKRIHFETYSILESMFKSYTTSDPLIFIRDNQVWLSIPFNVPSKPQENEKVVGVDLGMKRYITTSEGLIIDDKHYKGCRRKLRYNKRKLRSVGTKSARRKLRLLCHKERNMSKDNVYRSVKELLVSTSAGVISIEDLKKLKKNTKCNGAYVRKRHNSMLSQVAIAEFKRVLTYKAQLTGKRVVTVSPSWTSQIDSRSGRRDGTRRGCRYYCKDGVVLDADWNAAVNIAKRSKRPLSCANRPLDGRIKHLNGRSQVNRPIACKPRQIGSCKPLNL